MIEAENVKPYSATESKGEQVSSMFDNIAHSYDLMNTVMSMGLHRRWLRKGLEMLRQAYLGGGGSEMFSGAPVTDIIDVATGTGDVAFRLLREFPDSTVTGIDISPQMLAVARRRSAETGQENSRRVSFLEGDCLNLPFDDNRFGMATVAYGVRNFEHLQQGLNEIYRVLKPGGALCIIELSEPESPFWRIPYRLYTQIAIPTVGKLVSHDSRAYIYLPESIAACPQRSAMTLLMEKAGFRDCRWKSLTFGVITIYTGIKKN